MQKHITKIFLSLLLSSNILVANNLSTQYKKVMPIIINYILSSTPKALAFVSNARITLIEEGTMSFTIQATASINGIAYRIRGGDSNLFTIDENTGLVRFKTAPTQSNIHYNFEAIATDAQGNEVIQSIEVTIEADNTITAIVKDTTTSIEVVKAWYLRLVVEDIYNHLKTASTQLGQLDNIENIQDFNLKALTPFGSSYVDVVFKNPLAMSLGEYKNDFHSLNTQEDIWEFTVKSHDDNATMVLGWRGVYILSAYRDTEDRQRYTEMRMSSHPLLESMVLIDVSENIEIPILENGEKQEYLFYMKGSNTKVFQWKIKKPTALSTFQRKSLRPSKQKLDKLQIKALRMDAKIKRESKKEKKSFSPTQKPPHFEVLVK